MFQICSVPFTLEAGPYLRCNGTVTAVDTVDNLTGYLATCSSQFTFQDLWLVCNDTLSTKNNLSELSPTSYLFTLDSYTNTNNYFNSPIHLQNELVISPTIPVEPNQQVLSPADYSSLIALALPSLVLAFTFNFLYRQIINRN